MEKAARHAHGSNVLTVAKAVPMTHHDVRFGSFADILTSPRHVRFTPNHGCTSKSALAASL
jgi:hypothetical protein